MKSSFARLQPQRRRLAGHFLTELFAREPSFRPLFRGDAASEGVKLAEGLAAIVQSLDRLHGIAPALEWLAVRNSARGLGPRHYDAVAEALVATVEAGLGESLTLEVSRAWAAAVHSVIALMVDSVEPALLAA
ncbi:MAG TPA: globin domain-containing protein [Solirubrobacteraceae bacterium]